MKNSPVFVYFNLALLYNQKRYYLTLPILRDMMYLT